VPGIGRKTAERIVVDLRDKVEAMVVVPPKRGAVLPRAERFEDAIAALVALGYTAAQSQEAIRRAAEESEARSVEDLVRRALARLSRGAVTAR
jgi:Holliday junction DNA helicase RuvA